MVKGLPAIALLSSGQLASRAGTSMSRFGLTLWMWGTTASATGVTTYWLFALAPSILLSPVAGVVVDRCPRKWIMGLADLGASLGTVCLFVLLKTGGIETWHLYLAGGLASVSEAFQSPAQAASVTTMVREDQFARANGFLSASQFGASVLGPSVAGLLVGVIGLEGILVIDLASFLVGLTTLLPLSIPESEGHGAAPGKSLLQEFTAGAREIARVTGLGPLVALFAITNFEAGLFLGLLSPMVLARSGDDATVLGAVLASFGVGGTVGSVLLMLWGGPRRRIFGVLAGVILMSGAGIIPTSLGRSAGPWIAGAFLSTLFVPIINGCNRSIFQSRVRPEAQGRVFGVLWFAGHISFPLALALGGPMADKLFEPAMQSGAPLALWLGPVFGAGAGAGVAVVLAVGGLLGVVAGVLGFVTPSLLRVDQREPGSSTVRPMSSAEPGGCDHRPPPLVKESIR